MTKIGIDKSTLKKVFTFWRISYIIKKAGIMVHTVILSLWSKDSAPYSTLLRLVVRTAGFEPAWRILPWCARPGCLPVSARPLRKASAGGGIRTHKSKKNSPEWKSSVFANFTTPASKRQNPKDSPLLRYWEPLGFSSFKAV